MENNEFVRLKCVQEGSKLRIKIVTPGFIGVANCQFPKNIRVANREYLIPKADVTMADTKGKFFYRIKKNNIQIVEEIQQKNDYSNLIVYGDDDTVECSICMQENTEENSVVFVILVPCGHYCLCMDCAKQLKTCCMCRAPIKQYITKDQLQ